MSQLTNKAQSASVAKVMYVLLVINDMYCSSTKITYASVARAAGVTRAFLYKHAVIRRAINSRRQV